MLIALIGLLALGVGSLMGGAVVVVGRYLSLGMLGLWASSRSRWTSRLVKSGMVMLCRVMFRKAKCLAATVLNVVS